MSDENSSNNLSGLWTGVYDYPNDYKQPVPFNASIEDIDGALTGDISEPNTFSQAQDRELFAVLSGTRSGDNVHFVKSYEDRPQAGHSIAYNGTLNPGRTRIEGTWSLMEPGDSYSGPFVMNRKSGKKAEIAVKETVGAVQERVKEIANDDGKPRK